MVVRKVSQGRRKGRENVPEDLTRLLASAHPPVAPSAEFKEQLFRRLAAQVREEAPSRITDRLAGFLRGLAGQTPARRLALTGVATAAVFILVMGVSLVKQATAPPLGTLAMLEGTSQVMRPGGRFLGLGAPQALTIDAGEELALKTGDEVITGPYSKALLHLFDGSSIELAPGTWLSILQPTSAEGRPRLALELGALSVDEGLVHLTAGEEFAEVYAGEEVEVQAGQPLMVRARSPRTEMAEAYYLRAYRVMVSGQVNAGDSVELFLNGIRTATVTADAEGRFAYLIDTPQERMYTVSARSTNQQGHRSEEVILREFAIDRSPPPLAITSPWEPEVASSSVVLAGLTEPGAEVTIGEDRAMVDSDGAFSLLVELAPGSNPLTIKATDQAGNTLDMGLVITLQS